MLGRVTPYQYQREGVRAIEAFKGRALLADDMGLGKTVQVLHYLRRNPQALPHIVVCPAAVKYQWEREAGVQVGLRADVLEGQTPARPGFLRAAPLTIINFDIAQYWLDYLIALNPQGVTIDECQNIQNSETIRTKTMRYLCHRVPVLLGLSGTPLTNRPAELFPILNLLCPDKYPSFLDYAMRYCKPRKTPWGGWVYTGAQNLPELNRRLKKDCMIRRMKEDVLDQLPDKVRRVVPVPLSNMEEYLEAKNNFLGWLKKVGGPRKAAKAARAEKLVQIGYHRQLAARGKVRAIGAWVDSYLANTTEKLVVAAVHTKMIDALHRHYPYSVVINGAVTGRARTAAVEQFKNDNRCRLLIGNIKAMGTGVDGLQRVCRTMAVVELPWQPGVLTQLEDRLWRIGQNQKAWIYYLIAQDTIEEYLCEILQEKQSVLHATLNGEGEGDDLDILDMLIKRIAEEKP